SGWDTAKEDCNTDFYAVPCPGNLPCPDGQLCFAMGDLCVPVTQQPSLSPSVSPTTYAPTTPFPSASPIGADAIENRYYCGSDEEEAETCGGKWCRYGTHAECPAGQYCYVTSNCNATVFNYTDHPSPMPSVAPTTPSPTDDLNPDDMYCASEWRDENYEGECGIPCPGGMGECPGGMYCYGNQVNCVRTHKTKWCGPTPEAAADTCHQACPDGTDDECPGDETCWADSPCAHLDSKRAADAIAASKRWCAKTYKQLVEECPKPCPGGTDDECGIDEEGEAMVCFDMSTEDEWCNATGVGIKNKTDPDNLWCGTSWNHVLENCPKKCPEGTDEECGFLGACFDLTGNDLICAVEGAGVKVAGDPQERWCGSTYNQMMEFCPQRCPNGDECTGGMTCFEESPCQTVGEAAPGFVRLDSSKMFCGNDYNEATGCAQPCPGGSDSECASGKCWAEVQCGAGVAQSSNLIVQLTLDETTDAEAESEPETEPPASEPLPEDPPAEEDAPPAEDSDPPAEDPPADDPPAEDPPAEEAEDPPAEDSPPAEDPPAEDSPPAEDAPPEDSPSEEPVAQSAAAETETAEGATLAADNLRMALFGLDQMSATQLVAWEDMTAEYFADFYNADSLSPVSDVATRYDVTALSQAGGARVRSLRAGTPHRKLTTFAAYLLTYTQIVRYIGDVAVEEVVQRPFATEEGRAAYVAFLKTDALFANLESVSGVFLPEPFEARVIDEGTGAGTSGGTSGGGTSDGTSSGGTSSGGTSSINPFGDVDNSNPDLYSSGWHCHNSGYACPIGECDDGDLCLYYADASDTPIGPFTADDAASSSPDAAATLVTAALDGSYASSDPAGGDATGGGYTDGDFNALTSAAYGPADVAGLRMALIGVTLETDAELHDWKILTAEYEHAFYNEHGEMEVTDHIQKSVYSFQTQFEILEVTYGVEGNQPSTTIAFTQTAMWSSTDPDIPAEDIALRPFAEQEYRNAYAAFLIAEMPALFSTLVVPDQGYIITINAAPQEPQPQYADASPVESPSASQPSPTPPNVAPYYPACNICTPEQIGINAQIEFNGQLTNCSHAYNVMASNYLEGEANCVAAQEALAGACCADVAAGEAAPAGSPTTPTAPAGPTSPTVVSSDGGSPSSPTTVVSGDAVVANVASALEYPPDTYYCGSTLEDAANSCSIACPSGQDDECGGDLKCWGNTECMNRASFFCGTSWLDASDRCHKPCPTGDSFLECDAGEACFAWTSCDNTDSFYCGASFEDASANCAVECPSRSSVVDCPNGQGCFAYTTCEATKDAEHETDPLHVPMNDYFCGESPELAASTCSIACQGGQDSECPEGMQCYDDTGCSTRDSFWCGSSWRDAAETCGTPCTSGSPEQCPGDERCYAHTGCQANMFFCGETFEEAGASCSKPCE
ncbi:hypothetical protein ACHAXT_003438, partial [Thalassiosira profunda]